MTYEMLQERKAARELGKQEAENLLEYLQHTDYLDAFFAAQGISGSIALACEKDSFDSRDIDDIQQAARGAQQLLHTFYAYLEGIPAPKYIAASA